ncbi:replication-relaxation family protein [Kitasatospora sp. NPDC050463]|uniref:replication-relaxation family protein n=1 Tax=Kitasatospora sp. NPDC050463 TaxID=3155786 RepID=UPI0033CF81E5
MVRIGMRHGSLALVICPGGTTQVHGKRRVRPDAVLQAPETGVPVLMVEVDRSTMGPARVAAKFTAYPRGVSREGPGQRSGPRRGASRPNGALVAPGLPGAHSAPGTCRLPWAGTATSPSSPPPTSS